MLRSIIIAQDAGLAAPLEAALAETCNVGLVRCLDRYPSEQELPGIIRAHAPQLFFLDVRQLEEALRLAAAIVAQAPGAQIVALDRESDPRTLVELMRAGIREFVAVPESLGELAGVIERAAAALDRAPVNIAVTDEVITFLPAKPGVGCSTVALNTSVALAGESSARVLLADFDLNCGMIAFMLRLAAEHSLVDAAEHAAHLDEDLWPKLISKAGALEVLPSGPMRPGFRIEPQAMRYLLDFARRNYGVVCADLSGLMERFAVELMQESKRIFLVTTAELPALHLARQKLDYLRGLDLEGRVSLVLNRAQKRALVSSAEIEKIIGLPVAMEIPNDYRGVHKALSEAKPVDARSELGRSYAELARRILSKQPEAKKPHRFVDYFTITPARYSFEPRK
jgi:pilus assembly protein CpaE